MNHMKETMSPVTKITYEEAQMEVIEFSYVADIITTSSFMDENQGEWDPQL